MKIFCVRHCHTVRNIPPMDDQKGEQSLFRFLACHQFSHPFKKRTDFVVP